MEFKIFVTNNEETRDSFSLEKMMCCITTAFRSDHVIQSQSTISTILKFLNIGKIQTLEERLQHKKERQRLGFYMVADSFNLSYPTCLEIPKLLQKLGVFINIEEEQDVNDNDNKIKITKAEAIKLIKENIKEEELEIALTELVETENLDRRILNGRKAEEVLCEFVTNDRMWEIIENFIYQYTNKEIHPGKELTMLLEAFGIVLNDIAESKTGHGGKISFFHRFTESKLGTALSVTVRAMQKAASSFKERMQKIWESKSKLNLLKLGMGRFLRSQAERNAVALYELVEKIKKYLMSLPEFQTAIVAM